MPAKASASAGSADIPAYTPYPEHSVKPDTIGQGFAQLARRLAGCDTIAIDGVPAADWDAWMPQLSAVLEQETGRAVELLAASDRLLPKAELDAMLEPYLGGEDPLFGTRCPLTLRDFMDTQAMCDASAPPAEPMRIWFGPGAALLAPPDAAVVFLDVPKNEEQFRSRAGGCPNLSGSVGHSDKAKYKQAYFVDWPVLKRHKAALIPKLTVYVDAQFEQPTFMSGDDFRGALHDLARRPFRPRPWFEPGPWGGQWLLPLVGETCKPDTPNLAWSFEVIAPENGVVLSDGRWRCEVAMEWLLLAQGEAVQGFGHAFFEDEFPIRYDFLDTMDGGNLSLQCHPYPDYIREKFGERFTQDETYYIFDCKPDAKVYLGFHDGIDPQRFEAGLQESYRNNTEFPVEDFVQTLPAEKGDLFLIPHGTIHCSGEGNMVLEISATPYIFTFKMYDWLRLGLDGEPRPLNIDRAMANLRFDRCGEAVARELVSRPSEVASGQGWRHEELPTHADQFYRVDRYRLDGGGIDIETHNSPHVVMVVEGDRAELSSDSGGTQWAGFAQTFVIPAAAGRYRIAAPAGEPAVVVVAALKPGGDWPPWMKGEA